LAREFATVEGLHDELKMTRIPLICTSHNCENGLFFEEARLDFAV